MHRVYVMGFAEEARWFEVADEAVVGRSADCDVHLSDQRLSRRHAKLIVDGERLCIEDLGGANGTFINGRRLVERATLQDGDIVELGKSKLRVGAEGRSAAVVEGPAPDFIKPVMHALPPDLGDPVARGYFESLGVGDPTILETQANLQATLAKTRNFVILHEVSKRIQRELDARRMLESVMDVILEVTKAERGFVVLFDDEGGERVEVERHRVQRSGTTQQGPRLSQTVLRHVIDERSVVICGDSTADERFAQSESLFLSDTRSLMAAPILVPNRVLGLIELESSHLATRFTENDADLLSVTASTVGVALHNLRLADAREATIRALERAQEELLATQSRLVRSEQMAAIGRLATGIAHEVKNHLSPFMLAEMIAKKYPEDGQIQMASEMMLEAQQHILDLVQEIRTFVSGSPKEVVREPADLAQVVEGVVRFMKCDAVVKRTEVVVQIESRPVIMLDPKGLRQVLINLIKNAADALEGSGGKIEVGVAERGDRALLVVRDNGRGMPPDVQAKVFEPFFTTKGERGLGLGLDISKKIVEAHGGTMTLTSEVGAGTTFRIELPLDDEEHTDAPTATS
ncbi:MAG: ATP-binding protein [Deltaproteobacteria bacterium]